MPERRPRDVRSPESARPDAPADGRKEPPPSRRAQPEPDPDFAIPFPEAADVPQRAEARPAKAPQRPPQAEPKTDEIAAFRAILDRVNERRPELAAFLARASILLLIPGELRLGWEPGDIFGHGANDRDSQELLSALASEHFGAPTKVVFEFESARATTIKPLATIDAEMRAQKQRDAVAQAKKHRGITDAVEVLGARIKDLKLGPTVGQ